MGKVLTDKDKVTIYRFQIYDITNDEMRESRRWGTRDGVKAVGGAVIENTGVKVDASAVGHEIAGLTERNFNPRLRSGFQRDAS